MKMKNIEIERCINILNDQTCFRFDNKVKQPPRIRFAIRSNLDKLVAAYNTFNESRKEMIQGYVEEGIVSQAENGNYVIKDGYIDKVNKEVIELNNIDVDVDLILIDKNEMDSFLQTVSMSTPEEDVLLLFVRGEENG